MRTSPTCYIHSYQQPKINAKCYSRHLRAGESAVVYCYIKPHPESSGQQLNVQTETGDERCPSGVHTGTGTAEHLHQRRRRSAPSARLQMTPHWAARPAGLRDGMLERWAPISLMRFSKAKGRVLRPGRGCPRDRCGLVRRGWGVALPRRAWGCWGMNGWARADLDWIEGRNVLH